MEIENIKELTSEQTRQMQQKMLEILLYFNDFCNEHGLMYYLGGGCLIGAIRHHGFIPWDDDIDLFMPRAEYERLVTLWDEYGDKERFTYCRTDREKNFHHPAASIRDNNTTFINKHSENEDICHGIALEIMPIDACPKGRIARLWQLFNAAIFRLFNAQRLPDNKGRLLRVLAGIIYKIVPSKGLRYKLWKACERQMSKYSWDDADTVTDLFGAIRTMFIAHPKERFDSVTYKDFEGVDLPVPAGYDEYLHAVWGDYMQLPPIEKRTAKHKTTFISTERSYTEFKGVYYLCE